MSAPFVSGCLLALAPQQPADAGQPAPLDEVIANVQAQPLGPGTVADLALPDALLRRLADRILRASFEESFRVVVSEPQDGAGGRDAAPDRDGGARAAEEPPAPVAGLFRKVLNVLALIAVAVLAVLGYFALRARARRRS